MRPETQRFLLLPCTQNLGRYAFWLESTRETISTRRDTFGSLTVTLQAAHPLTTVRERSCAPKTPIFFEVAGRDSSFMKFHSILAPTNFTSTLLKQRWTAKACAMSVFPLTGCQFQLWTLLPMPEERIQLQ